MNLASKITVGPESNGERLDIFLSKELAITRSQAQKMVKRENVLINKKFPKKPGEKINTDDKITIKKSDTKPKAKTTKADTKKPGRIKIIKENDDYLVINKPAGLLTHPTKDSTLALTDWLLKKYPELKQVGDNPIRPGIVHRLDKEASGLLVVARNQKMFAHLKKQFQKRKIDKEYTVLVHGQVQADTDTIDFPLTRSKNSERMAAVPATKKGVINEDGKKSLTEFWVEKRFINFTLLKVKIHTGRTHQIRAHMLAYNHPVVGDKVYWQKKQNRKWDEQLNRLFLHSTKLGFADLKNENQVFTCKLPRELKLFLEKVK